MCSRIGCFNSFFLLNQILLYKKWNLLKKIRLIYLKFKKNIFKNSYDSKLWCVRIRKTFRTLLAYIICSIYKEIDENCRPHVTVVQNRNATNQYKVLGLMLDRLLPKPRFKAKWRWSKKRHVTIFEKLLCVTIEVRFSFCYRIDNLTERINGSLTKPNT